ncbi:MAG: serine hydrolase [Flavobacteriales bacterium]|nr:serine hydrolase [Flavobacteriales bacterium]
MKRIIVVLVAVVIVVAVGLVGFYIGKSSNGVQQKPQEKKTASSNQETRIKGNYKLINPLLECDNFVASDIASHNRLRGILKEYVQGAKRKGMASDIAVYYRDLNNGPWIGIDEQMVFAPASLLKVPLIMAAFKYSEISPDFLQTKILYSRVTNEYAANIADSVIRIGQRYTMLELVERMAVYSDNNAMDLVIEALTKEGFDAKIWTDLGLPVPNTETPDNFLSVKDYSSFFRILYNSTYLTPANSERVLQILTRTQYKQAMRSGVPPTVVVASKFGERGLPDSPAKQLHECGIVYDGDTQYLLCVMTKGLDWQAQAEVIQEISKLVYENR